MSQEYERTGICLWCREYIEDAREHSGWTRPETDWAAPFEIDGVTHYDWGCHHSPWNSDEGTGGHVHISDVRRKWVQYEKQDEAFPAMLEALKGMVSQFSQKFQIKKDYHKMVAFEAARTAITKTEGKGTP